MLVYHGSKSLFDKWDYNKMGKNATSEGFGFYFTDNKSIAEGYAQNGYLYTVEFKGQKSLSSTKKTITRAQLKKFIEQLHKVDEDQFLYNYDDVSFKGYNKVLSYAVALTYDNNDNDVDMICELCNVYGSKEIPLTELYKMFGYDSIQLAAEWGEQNLYIALVNDIIKIVNVNKLP